MVDHVVVVGAGFAGLTVARELVGKPVRVTILDRHNYHLFQPLLYQVATAVLDPQEIAEPVRAIFQDAKNVDFRLAAATGVDWGRQEVLLDAGGPLAFDYLVIAAGATTETLDIDGVSEHTYPMKALEDATRLRDHVLRQFERVDADPSLIDEGALTFVIVGAGPTGVELCGALVDLIDHVLSRDFPHVESNRRRVVLVEALPHVLAMFSRPSREYARRTLEGRGVEVLLESTLEEVTPGAVRLDDATTIAAGTIVWTAGVRAQPLASALDLEQTGGGRIVVTDDLSVPGHPNVFAVGDVAGARDRHGDLYPQLAPVAMQQGSHAVRQIALRRQGRETEPFRYDDKGIMATIGPDAAVTELPSGMRLAGRRAWFVWLGAHLLFLIGYRNRARVFFDWAYSYLASDRASRLIVGWQEEPRMTQGEASAGA